MFEHPAITRTMRYGHPDIEPEIVGECEGCGGDIYEGEDIYDFNGALLHQDSSCCKEFISNAGISKTA